MTTADIVIARKAKKQPSVSLSRAAVSDGETRPRRGSGFSLSTDPLGGGPRPRKAPCPLLFS